MSQSEQHKQQQKVVQYLNEAHATEQALTRVLQSQIAMTPRGAYRTALETHLRETRGHAQRVARRLEGLGQGSNPLLAVVGAVEAVVGQALALGKGPSLNKSRVDGVVPFGVEVVAGEGDRGDLGV
jgi:ferritin-like metal-binding protein YciE